MNANDYLTEVEARADVPRLVEMVRKRDAALRAVLESEREEYRGDADPYQRGFFAGYNSARRNICRAITEKLEVD